MIKLLDIADTPEKQERGFQFVKDVPALSGILFQFKHPKVLSFWMKDTYVPLEIAFVDNAGTIVKTEKMIPLSTRAITSDIPCVAALEVPTGTFDQMGVIKGKKISVNKKDKLVTIND